MEIEGKRKTTIDRVRREIERWTERGKKRIKEKGKRETERKGLHKER